MKIICLYFLSFLQISCVNSQISNTSDNNVALQLSEAKVDSLLTKFFDNNRPQEGFRTYFYVSEVQFMQNKPSGRYQLKLIQMPHTFEEGIIEVDTVGRFAFSCNFMCISQDEPFSKVLLPCNPFSSPCMSILAVRLIPKKRYTCDAENLHYTEKYECQTPILLEAKEYISKIITFDYNNHFDIFYDSTDLFYKDHNQQYFMGSSILSKEELREIYKPKN